MAAHVVVGLAAATFLAAAALLAALLAAFLTTFLAAFLAALAAFLAALAAFLFPIGHSDVSFRGLCPPCRR